MKRRKFKIDSNQLSFSLRKKIPLTNRLPVLILAFLILVFSFRAVIRVYENKEESAKATSEVVSQLETIEQRKEFLLNSIKKLSTEKGVEDELRKRFGVVRPDENVAIIVASQDNIVSSSTPNFWDKLKDFFR